MANKTNILLAEDDQNLSTLLEEYLSLKGFNVKLCRDGDEAFAAFQQNGFDLCLLDIMMPKKDGFTLAKDIRKMDKAVPIIFLTAKGMKEDKIEGFELGADDYITKPFSMEELLARVNAVLRRTLAGTDKTDDTGIYRFGKFEFDYNQQLLKNGKETNKLTTKESELLRLLALNKNKVLERQQALIKIWGNDSYFTARSMDVFITKLRKYLKPDGNIQIMNIHGTGYKLIVNE